jgi:peptidoglycan/LPS O-acetylase OafA/YrhL
MGNLSLATHPDRPNILGQITEHVPALDGIRGIAILTVLAAHFGGGRKFESPIMRMVGQLMASGWVGVDLFFVLSGFLITGILLKTASDPNYYRSFYGRRVLRIFPIYYLTLFVTLFASLAMSQPWRWDQYSFFLFANNIAVVFDDNLGAVGPGLMLSAFWSLAVEEQFYLFWPYLLKAATRRRTLVWLFSGAMAGALLLRIFAVNVGSPNAAYNLLFSRMDSLAAGGLLAQFLRQGALRNIPARVPFGLLFLAILAFLSIGYFERTLAWNTNWMMTVGFDVTALGAFALIWSVLIPKSPTQWLCQTRPLRFFGKYSYGMYIYHQILQNQMMRYIYPAMARLFHSQVLGAIGYFFTAILLVTLVSVLSYELYEIKFLRLKGLFPYQKGPQAELSSRELQAAVKQTTA